MINEIYQQKYLSFFLPMFLMYFFVNNILNMDEFYMSNQITKLEFMKITLN